MDKDQSRGRRASRGRGRTSSRSSERTPLRPFPSELAFSRPLLAGSAQSTGDGSGPSSSPPRITHTGDGSRPSSSPPHSEHRDEGEAEIEPPLDHVREEDGARYIIPDETSTGFIPSHTAAGAIYDAIKAHFEQPWAVWREIPLEFRDRMFSEFKRKVYWLPRNDENIRRAFEVRGAKCFADIFHQIRHRKTRPQWIGDHVWECFQKHWASEAFKKRQIQAKEARASEKGGSLNSCGSISLATHAARIEHTMGKRPSKIDLFLIDHKKKNPETRERDQWVDSRAEATYNAFQSLAAEERLNQTETTDDSTARTQNPPRSDEELFTQAVGGVDKGRVYGIENQPSTSCSVYSASPSIVVSRAEYDLMRHRVAELTEEVSTRRQQITELTEEVSTRRQQITELTEEVSTRQQQMTELIQSLQAKIEKMEKRSKKKRKTSNNEDTDSSTDTDND